MALHILLAVVPPPAEPCEGGDNLDWPGVERSLGVALPGDYKGYIETYGSGCVGGLVWPLNPFSATKALNLIAWGREQLGALRIIKDKYGAAQCPYPLYPEPGGLLPWGAIDNGDPLFWLTGGPPEAWQVVIGEARGPTFEQYEETATGFLAHLVTGEIASNILPTEMLDRNRLLSPLDAYYP